MRSIHNPLLIIFVPRDVFAHSLLLAFKFFARETDTVTFPISILVSVPPLRHPSLFRKGHSQSCHHKEKISREVMILTQRISISFSSKG